MKKQVIKVVGLSLVLILSAVGFASGNEEQSPRDVELSEEKIILNGLSANGLKVNDSGSIASLNGLEPNGLSVNAVRNGLEFNGRKLPHNGIDWNGHKMNGLDFNGLSMNGLGKKNSMPQELAL